MNKNKKEMLIDILLEMAIAGMKELQRHMEYIKENKEPKDIYNPKD